MALRDPNLMHSFIASLRFLKVHILADEKQGNFYFDGMERDTEERKLRMSQAADTVCWESESWWGVSTLRVPGHLDWLQSDLLGHWEARSGSCYNTCSWLDQATTALAGSIQIGRGYIGAVVIAPTPQLTNCDQLIGCVGKLKRAKLGPEGQSWCTWKTNLTHSEIPKSLCRWEPPPIH